MSRVRHCKVAGLDVLALGYADLADLQDTPAGGEVQDTAELIIAVPGGGWVPAFPDEVQDYEVDVASSLIVRRRFGGFITQSVTDVDGTEVVTKATCQGYSLLFDRLGLPVYGQTLYTLTCGDATGGTFTLSFAGQTTSAIAYNATIATVQARLRALSTIGSPNVTVTEGPLPAGSAILSFVHALGLAGVLTADFSGLTFPVGVDPDGDLSPLPETLVVAAGTFFDQVTYIVNHCNVGGSSTRTIDLTQVPNWEPGITLDEQEFENLSLREMLQAVFDNLAGYAADLGRTYVPLMRLGPSNAATPTFDDPMLFIWNTGDVGGTPQIEFSTRPTGGEVAIATLHTVTRDASARGTLALVTAGDTGFAVRADPVAISAAPNPFAPAATWRLLAKQIQAADTQADLDAAALKYLNAHKWGDLTAEVEALAAFDSPGPVGFVTPGTLATVTDDLQGFDHMPLYVATQTDSQAGPETDKGHYQLGNRIPLLGDADTDNAAGVAPSPQTAPPRVTNLHGTSNVYQGPTHSVTYSVAWDRPNRGNLRGYYVRSRTRAVVASVPGQWGNWLVSGLIPVGTERADLTGIAPSDPTDPTTYTEVWVQVDVLNNVGLHSGYCDPIQPYPQAALRAYPLPPTIGAPTFRLERDGRTWSAIFVLTNPLITGTTATWWMPEVFKQAGGHISQPPIPVPGTPPGQAGATVWYVLTGLAPAVPYYLWVKGRTDYYDEGAYTPEGPFSPPAPSPIPNGDGLSWGTSHPDLVDPTTNPDGLHDWAQSAQAGAATWGSSTAETYEGATSGAVTVTAGGSDALTLGSSPLATQAGRLYSWRLPVKATHAAGTVVISALHQDKSGATLRTDALWSGTPATSWAVQEGQTTVLTPANTVRTLLQIAYTGGGTALTVYYGAVVFAQAKGMFDVALLTGDASQWTFLYDLSGNPVAIAYYSEASNKMVIRALAGVDGLVFADGNGNTYETFADGHTDIEAPTGLYINGVLYTGGGGGAPSLLSILKWGTD